MEGPTLGQSPGAAAGAGGLVQEPGALLGAPAPAPEGTGAGVDIGFK